MITTCNVHDLLWLQVSPEQHGDNWRRIDAVVEDQNGSITMKIWNATSSIAVGHKLVARNLRVDHFNNRVSLSTTQDSVLEVNDQLSVYRHNMMEVLLLCKVNIATILTSLKCNYGICCVLCLYTVSHNYGNPFKKWNIFVDGPH